MDIYPEITTSKINDDGTDKKDNISKTSSANSTMLISEKDKTNSTKNATFDTNSTKNTSSVHENSTTFSNNPYNSFTLNSSLSLSEPNSNSLSKENDTASVSSALDDLAALMASARSILNAAIYEKAHEPRNHEDSNSDEILNNGTILSNSRNNTSNHLVQNSSKNSINSSNKNSSPRHARLKTVHLGDPKWSSSNDTSSHDNYLQSASTHSIIHKGKQSLKTKLHTFEIDHTLHKQQYQSPKSNHPVLGRRVSNYYNKFRPGDNSADYYYDKLPRYSQSKLYQSRNRTKQWTYPARYPSLIVKSVQPNSDINNASTKNNFSQTPHSSGISAPPMAKSVPLQPTDDPALLNKTNALEDTGNVTYNNTQTSQMNGFTAKSVPMQRSSSNETTVQPGNVTIQDAGQILLNNQTNNKTNNTSLPKMSDAKG